MSKLRVLKWDIFPPFLPSHAYTHYARSCQKIKARLTLNWACVLALDMFEKKGIPRARITRVLVSKTRPA